MLGKYNYIFVLYNYIHTTYYMYLYSMIWTAAVAASVLRDDSWETTGKLPSNLVQLQHTITIGIQLLEDLDVNCWQLGPWRGWTRLSVAPKSYDIGRFKKTREKSHPGPRRCSRLVFVEFQVPAPSNGFGKGEDLMMPWVCWKKLSQLI